MAELSAAGVRFALDDFGTGYSSLSYLKRLPIDKIKIDRSFIRDIATDHHDAAITQGIISMAHHLSLTVVTEGVETASQVAFLKGSRCDIFQGYYFAKPMPAAQLELFIQQYHTQRQIRPESVSNQQTILLVDDDFSTLVAIKACLEKRHFTVYQSHIQYHLCMLTSKMPGYSDLLKLQPKWCNPKTPESVI